MRSDPRRFAPASMIVAPLLALALAGCAFRSMVPSADDNAPQTYPDNYRSEIPPFLRSYLSDPVGLREAAVAVPVLREAGGRSRYVACVRFVPAQSTKPQQIGIVFLNGRLDRALQTATEACAAAAYAPFPELEKLSR